MNNQTKNNLRSKARLLYGLLNIIKYDIDNLRMDAADWNLIALAKSVEDTTRTLENMVDLIAEIEYILYLNALEESR